MYVESGYFETYREEMEFDYLVTGYLAGVKTLALRFTTDTYEDFLLLCKNVKDKIENPLGNVYVDMLSEFNRLQLQLLYTEVSRDEWEQFCIFYRKNAG